MAEEKTLTADDVRQAHNSPGGDAWLRANGAGDLLDEYLASVEQGITWNPNDMSNVPPSPNESKLDQAGRRHSVNVSEIPDGEDLPPYTEWSHEDLVAECEQRGLSNEGDDDDLALRLLENDDEADAETQKSYASMKKDEMQAECDRRGLSTEGTKDELRARLQEDDATRGE